jgi:hypothetical protein
VHCPFHQPTSKEEGEIVMAKRPGLYANIAAKRRRIKAGSKKKMRKPGYNGATTAKAFRDSTIMKMGCFRWFRYYPSAVLIE